MRKNQRYSLLGQASALIFASAVTAQESARLSADFLKQSDAADPIGPRALNHKASMCTSIT